MKTPQRIPSVLPKLLFLVLLIFIIAVICCTDVGGSIIRDGDGSEGSKANGPRLTLTPPPRVVFSSETGVILVCLAEGSPSPSVTWVTGDGDHHLTPHSTYVDIMNNGSLVIRPFPPDRYRADIHGAKVRCKASNQHGVVISPAVTLLAVVWQDFSLEAKGGRTVIGGSVLLKCIVPSHLKTYITPTVWETSTHTIYPTLSPDGRYQMIGSTGDLLVRSVTPNDALTTFNCRVKDTFGGEHQLTSRNPAKIIVQEPGEASRPVIQNKIRTVTVPEGGSIVIPCLASGNAIPTVRWNSYTGGALGGSRISDMDAFGGHRPYSKSLGSAVLVIDTAQMSDAHAYTCTANNSLGIDQMTVEVVVETPLGVSVTPSVLEVGLGGTATFTCKVSADSGVKISWYYNGKPIMGGNGRLVVAGNQLIISGINHEDPGMYQCQAIKGMGQSAQQAAQLVMADSVPVLHYRFIEQSIRPGPSVSLRCSAVGNPTPSIKWTLDGIPLLHSSDRVIVGEQVSDRGKVVGHVNISHTRVEDGGRYDCIASNRAGATKHTAHLNIYGIPVGRPIGSVTAVAGQPLELRCPVAGYPLHSFVWTKDNVPLTTTLERRMENDGTLTIETVKQPDDSGVYTCTASNKQSRAATGSVQVYVLVPPRIEPFTFQEGISEGKRIRVICTVTEGDSPIKLEWLKDGRPLSLDGPSDIQVKLFDEFSSVLAISPLKAMHSGRYTCRAQNSVSVARYTAFLNVHVPPTWVLEPQDVRMSRGHSLMIDCVSRGHPDPTVTWKKKIISEPPNSGSESFLNVADVVPRAVQLSNGSLYISRMEPDHEGIYLCQAANSVTHISKTVSVDVSSSPYFLSGGRRSVEVRSGEIATLECRVRGDSPLKVIWSLRGISLRPSARYKESSTLESNGGDTLARLEITSVAVSDSGIYSCTAQNTYGRNSNTITLSVHEPPSAPRGLRVLTEGSRSVKVSWSNPEPRPSSYILKFHRILDGWNNAREIVIDGATSVTSGVEVSPLMPATEYILKVTAINKLGRSPPSEDLRILTSAEKPSAPPRDLRVESTGSTHVRVSWKSPSVDSTHGTILGYYLGHALVNKRSRISMENPQYNFTTVESSEGIQIGIEGQDSLMTTLKGLKPYTDYQLVVQAFNTEGAGPLSSPTTVTTREDAPGSPPTDSRCIGLSWDSVQITWVSPDPQLHHGVLRGYKLDYERWDGWSDARRQTQTTAMTSVLTGLEAATNYSVRVRAYTSAGDGPWSSPTLCSTEEDVPGRPTSVRGIVSGSGAFIVSWAPPIRPGGRIVSYTVTWRVVGARMTGSRGTEGITTVTGKVNYVQIEDVSGNLVEVEVAASTRIGKGPSGAARVTLTNTVPAAIYSTSSTIRAEQGKDVTLPCGHVGEPKPRLVWTYQGHPLISSKGRMVKGGGGLLIQESQRQDSGNYTCTVSNVHGSDHATFSLTILVPPSAPMVLASSDSVNSIRVQWKQGDKGGAPVTEFTLFYKKDHGSWTQLSVNRHQYSYTIKGLECGSKYHVYVVAHNIVGSSPASTTAIVRTVGGPPQPPQPSHFLTPNSSSVTLFPKAWIAHGCPITHLGIEYRRQNQQHWIQVSGGSPHGRKVLIDGLESSTSYFLKTKAVSSAGTSTFTYSFTTLTDTGGIPGVWSGRPSAQWVSVRVLLPLLTSIVALASSLCLVCYCVRKKSDSARSIDGSKEESSERTVSTASRENKHNLAQREQYYATIRKANQQQGDRVPENAEDIYPYATFELPEPPPSQDPNHIHMYPIYQTRTSDKKIENYEEIKRRNSQGHCQRRGRSRSRSRSCSRGGIAESGDDYETFGSDTETEHGCVSSRTESSNQLDDMSSIRDQSIYIRGPPNKDPRDPVYSREVARATSKDSREPVYSREVVRVPSKDSREPIYSREVVRATSKDRKEPIYTREVTRPSHPSSKDPRQVIYSREVTRTPHSFSQDSKEPIYSRDKSRVLPPFSKDSREPIYSRDNSTDTAFQQRIHHSRV